MINILSYAGMTLQSEVCLWTLLGLVRTIFDATLFKVNANLKQVWQMTMPPELSLPVQRVLRTMISGVMLVKCFTVYVYLASYIVLLYPVFLEERPTLVLPWLLLAAIRKLLCELTSLALGLGTCVLLGPARPACIRFLILKIISIMPSFYMWMLLLSYYHTLKLALAFKSFPAVLPQTDYDYGLELAIRRRRTKSLLGEEQLRSKLVTSFYNQRTTSGESKINYSSRLSDSPDTVSTVDYKADYDTSLLTSSNRMADIGRYEDWFGSEVTIPRDTDRILEQFGVMMLRLGAYLKKGPDTTTTHLLESNTFLDIPRNDHFECSAMPADCAETPPLVGNSKCNTASYVQQYPHIFMKKHSEIPLRLQSEDKVNAIQTVSTQIENDENVKKVQSVVLRDQMSETEDVETNKKKNVPEPSNKISSQTTNSKLIMNPNYYNKEFNRSDEFTKPSTPGETSRKRNNKKENGIGRDHSNTTILLSSNSQSISDGEIDNKNVASSSHTAESNSHRSSPSNQENKTTGNNGSTNTGNNERNPKE